MKNVTGYDLPKLFAGACGALGIMTEVTVKTMPAPADSATLAMRDLSDEAALAALRRAAASTLELSGLAHLPANITGGRAQTLFRLEGPIAAVTDRLNRLKSLLQEAGEFESLSADAAITLWRRVRDAEFFTGDTLPLWRLSVPPQQGAIVAAQIGAKKYYYDWAGGLIWLLHDSAAHVREAVQNPAVTPHCSALRKRFAGPFRYLSRNRRRWPHSKIVCARGLIPSGFLIPARV